MLGGDDDGGGGPINECPEGFVRVSDDCVCEDGNFQFGVVDCTESIDSGFMYSPLEGCPGGMAVKLTDDFKHSVVLRGQSYDRMGMQFIHPNEVRRSSEILEASFLRKSIDMESDSIIFELLIGNYFSFDTLDSVLPRFIFHGVREDSTSLRGTMSWGERLDYWEFGEIYGSCDAVFRLPE